MIRTLANGKSGLISNQNRIDAISNNIANIDTSGYKRIDIAFSDILNESVNRLGVPITAKSKENLSIGSGVKGDVTVRDFSQGILKETGKATDLAIEGCGYFRLKDGNGNYFYTRDGAFNIDSNGNFVHSSGLLLDINGYVGLNNNDKFRITTKGEILKFVDGKEEFVGQIKVYDIKGKDFMLTKGENIFLAKDVVEIDEAKIKQGYLEKSNTDIIQEMTNMVVTQRAFELNARTVRLSDEMWQISNNIRGK
ncbi:flagellar basal-body rod protein FlgG [Caloramator fervidus]|uniref:Flagellar basal-body rod protein FlgG n=1 Tax=Caloramator fervidus TaxID=29344 RepID=A0A1H5SC41_9CLOT|nr:flagellar hook-basal body complex protein [Caloramator fervidus]SEF47558.1 flagellar basal-body rod protein FlgG [Caloramator fervidus]